jgi:small multidrug resistance pump
MKYYVLLSLAVVCNATSYIFYKYSSINSSLRKLSIGLLLIGLLFGAINSTAYTKSLKGISLNTAYPIFSAGSIILVTLISIILFHETISTQKIIGIGVLIIGVIIVSV